MSRLLRGDSKSLTTVHGVISIQKTRPVDGVRFRALALELCYREIV